MIKLEEPSMAINDCRSKSNKEKVQRYQMTYTWDVNSWNPKQAPMVQKKGGRFIAQYIAAIAKAASYYDESENKHIFVGKLRNLVINCHGTPGQLKLGINQIDSSDIRHFSICKGLVEKIWLPSCYIAQKKNDFEDGIKFCSNLAKTVGCYVVAPSGLQCASFTTIPRNYIEGFEGPLFSFGPEGNITWSFAYPPAWRDEEGYCRGGYGSYDYTEPQLYQ